MFEGGNNVYSRVTGTTQTDGAVARSILPGAPDRMDLLG
jgi:hypothetical protein